MTATEPAEPTEAVAPVEAAAAPAVAAVPLTEPRDGVPAPLTHPDARARVVDVLARGSGPIAVDAERASGYRYGQAAYLVQLRRADLGTVLIDPRALPDLTELGAAMADDEWVLHAASQDLPCLAELGMRPAKVFDTELAGRLLGYPKVGLGSIVEEVLGLSLEKGHSAADWSTRPLPEPWLRYAALDVEVLVELRDVLARGSSSGSVSGVGTPSRGSVSGTAVTAGSAASSGSAASVGSAGSVAVTRSTVRGGGG